MLKDLKNLERLNLEPRGHISQDEVNGKVDKENRQENMNKRMGKSQTKQNVHHITELLIFWSHTDIKFQSTSQYATFSLQILAKKAKGRQKAKTRCQVQTCA